MPSRQSRNPAVLAAALPLLPIATVLTVLAGAGANAAPTASTCGGGGTAQVVTGVRLDSEQMGNAATIVDVTARRRLPVEAAVIALTTAYTESRLHNSAVQSDHDSEGLFQQRVSIYTEPVAIDPVRATGAFLDRLVRLPGWRTIGIGTAAQAVQISRYPERYQPNAPLARALTGLLWPTALAAAAPTRPVAPLRSSAPSPARATTTASSVAVCTGAGGPAAGLLGRHGNPIGGITTVPPGFVITGTLAGQRAVRFALTQLGKPYVFGAAGPSAFDCSGLTMTAWAHAGIALPHLAAAQTDYGTAIPPTLSTAVGGDLVMTAGADGTPANPGHVGMIAGYLPRRDGRHLYLIQAPTPGVPVELTEASQWAGQITNARHLA